MFNTLAAKFRSSIEQAIILVDISTQTLSLVYPDNCVKSWPVSTATNGSGNQQGSLQTPLGAHTVAEKIGANASAGSIFSARQPTGQIATVTHESVSTGQDLVTSRILWIKGLEPGFNQGRGVDTYERYIYIHGTPEEGLIGTPASHGCVRMRNEDVIELFDLVTINTPVYLCESQDALKLV